MQQGKNKIADWIDVNIRTIDRKYAGSPVKTVLGKVSTYAVERESEAAMWIRGPRRVPQSKVYIDDRTGFFRPKVKIQPFFEGMMFDPVKDPFFNAFIHEGRHGYQCFLVRDIQTNDEDTDWLPKNLEEGVPAPAFDFPAGSPDARKLTLQDEDDKKHLHIMGGNTFAWKGYMTDLEPMNWLSEQRLVEDDGTRKGILVTDRFQVKDTSKLGILEIRKLQFVDPSAKKPEEISQANKNRVTRTKSVIFYRVDSPVRVNRGSGIVTLCYRLKKNIKPEDFAPGLMIQYIPEAKDDPQSVWELDAHHWAAQNE
jgi:hypothetical protein